MTPGRQAQLTDEADKLEELESEGVFGAIVRERLYQDRKYGTPSQRDLSISAYLIIMRHELGEAMKAVANNSVEDAMIELLQVVAVGVAAMEQHGVFERPDVSRKVFY